MPIKQLALILFVLAAPLAAQGTGQTSYRIVVTQDMAVPHVRGVGFAVVHGLWSASTLAIATSASAVKVGTWSQGVGFAIVLLPLGYVPLAWVARATPYVAGEMNKTTVGGRLRTGYVAFVGVSINDLGRERVNRRGAKVTPSWIHEARQGWLVGGRYVEYNLGYAP